MPLTLEAGILFSVLVAPGFLFVRGFARRRTRTAPERDLYALAQAIVASLFFLALLWLGLSASGHGALLGDLYAGEAAGHETTIFWIVLALLVVPFPLGSGLAALTDWIGSEPRRFPAPLLHWTGLFSPPTSWDALWLNAVRRGWALVAIDYRDGSHALGLFARDSKVDLSPVQTPRVFFEQEYRYVDGEAQLVQGKGFWVRADEAAFIRIRAMGKASDPVEGSDAP